MKGLRLRQRTGVWPQDRHREGSFVSIFRSYLNSVRQLSSYFHFIEKETKPQKREGIVYMSPGLWGFTAVNFPQVPQYPIVFLVLFLTLLTKRVFSVMCHE